MVIGCHDLLVNLLCISYQSQLCCSSSAAADSFGDSTDGRALNNCFISDQLVHFRRANRTTLAQIRAKAKQAKKKLPLSQGVWLFFA